LKPSNDEELGVQLKVTEWLAGAEPVPVSGMTRGELAALLVTVTLPERLPVVVGANVTLKEVDCKAVRVTGSAKPLALNPAPLAAICETDTLLLPVFVRVTFCVALVCVVTLPKLTEVRLGVSWSTVETPVPASGTTTGELGALAAKVRLPEKLVAEVGVKPTVTAVDPPGGTETGVAIPPGGRLKPVPATDAWLTLRFAVPVLLTVKVCVLVTPTVTLPKPMLEGTTEISGCRPLPESGITVGEFVALLTTLRLPDAIPEVVGAKVTVSGRLWLAARVSAPVNPLRLNPPLVLACEMLTLEMLTTPVPVFVTVNV
jgi:hypothetical protein